MDNQVILTADGQQSEKTVIIYRSEDGTIQLDVELYNETVWLTRPQMALLFNTTPQNVTMHIGNIYTEEELTEEATSKDFLLVQNEGGRNIKRRAKFYNLDVIISVGYRVKSKRGTQFRKWANNVLKEYMLRGYAVNNRLDRLEVKVYKLEEKTTEIETEIKGQLPPHEGIFYNGQIIERFNKSHDRFLIIDDEVYLIGASIKDLGKKVSTFIKLSIQKEEFLQKILN